MFGKFWGHEIQGQLEIIKGSFNRRRLVASQDFRVVGDSAFLHLLMSSMYSRNFCLTPVFPGYSIDGAMCWPWPSPWTDGKIRHYLSGKKIPQNWIFLHVDCICVLGTKKNSCVILLMLPSSLFCFNLKMEWN